MKKLTLVFMLAAPTAYSQSFDNKLIGGTPADPKDWPASVYASMGGSRCSATVVGERVVFIAAHCVSNGGSASFTVGPNKYTAKCTHSPHYRNDSTADWALCLTNNVVTGIPYEIVNTDAALVKVGDTVTLTGYGCTKTNGNGGNDGIYRVGTAPVTRVPTTSSNDIITKGSAALCYGDSGGSAYVYTDAAKTQRVMISVNSRGNIKDTSYLSSVSTPKAKTFINDWATKNGVVMCGVHAEATGCRGAIAQPELPEECQNLTAHLATWSQCLTKVPAPEQAACEEALDMMQACYITRY